MAERKYNPVCIESTCINCGGKFDYPYKAGAKRSHCSSECRNAWRKKLADERLLKRIPCSIDGCNGLAVRVSSCLCEKHYSRKRRGISVEDKAPKYSYKTASGYIVKLDPSHPLAMSDGRVHEHRMVAFAKHNGDCPDCFWCGAHLVWKTAVIDHLDENKQNNIELNLVVSCGPCNRARGAMLPFVARMKEESVSLFIEMISLYRNQQS